MPDGIGKVTASLRRRFPRSAHVWDHYHRTIVAILTLVFLCVIGFLGIESIEAGNKADKAAKEIRIVKQSANCQPDASGKPLRPKKCAESISTGFRTLSPLQACELLQKGAKVIYIGGQKIPPVTCTPQQRQTNRTDNALEAEGKEPSADPKASGGAPTATNPATGDESTPTTPAPQGTNPSAPPSGSPQGNEGAKSPQAQPSPTGNAGGGATSQPSDETRTESSTSTETTHETTVVEKEPPAPVPTPSSSVTEVNVPGVPLELCLLKPVVSLNCNR